MRGPYGSIILEELQGQKKGDSKRYQRLSTRATDMNTRVSIVMHAVPKVGEWTGVPTVTCVVILCTAERNGTHMKSLS